MIKPKAAFFLSLAALLAPMLSGCLCSYAVIKKTNESTADTFHPDSVYQLPPHGDFALEGTRHNQNQTQAHAFVIVPQERLPRPLTNEVLSLDGIKELSTHIDTTQLDTRSKLPHGYSKVADFPTNDVNIVIVVHKPKAYMIVFLPFAVAVDIVGFPVEYIYMLSSPHYW